MLEFCCVGAVFKLPNKEVVGLLAEGGARFDWPLSRTDAVSGAALEWAFEVVFIAPEKDRQLYLRTRICGVCIDA